MGEKCLLCWMPSACWARAEDLMWVPRIILSELAFTPCSVTKTDWQHWKHSCKKRGTFFAWKGHICVRKCYIYVRIRFQFSSLAPSAVNVWNPESTSTGNALLPADRCRCILHDVLNADDSTASWNGTRSFTACRITGASYSAFRIILNCFIFRRVLHLNCALFRIVHCAELSALWRQKMFLNSCWNYPGLKNFNLIVRIVRG